MGKGGAQHQAIQLRLKEAAEKLGFRGVIEKQVLDGQGSVDLLLEGHNRSIACEISLTTTIDHEVGNIAKCYRADYREIAVISVENDRLRKIETAVSGSLGPEPATCTKYFNPESFIAYLQSLVPTKPEQAEPPAVRRGYKVKRSTSTLSPADRKQREETAIKIIADTMRPKSR